MVLDDFRGVPAEIGHLVLRPPNPVGVGEPTGKQEPTVHLDEKEQRVATVAPGQRDFLAGQLRHPDTRRLEPILVPVPGHGVPFSAIIIWAIFHRSAIRSPSMSTSANQLSASFALCTASALWR